jgi:Winged helix DNA-binding domain
MANLHLAQQRQHNQQLTQHKFAKPAEVVQWLGAVQAQDYAGAKWAVAQRTPSTTDAVIEQAFSAGAILRTHVLRPTWHFVAPADIRWLLALTAPRVHALNAYYYRKLGLDEATFARSNAALAQALAGGQQLTRPELAAVLEQVGIAASDLRLSYLMMQAELDGLICSGARRGKQFTYALLAERAPLAKLLEHDEALAELVKRYFTGHGPATLADFVWWSGLSVTEAKTGLAGVESQLTHERVDGQSYWCLEAVTPAQPSAPLACLLPNYDEGLASYKDRSAVLDAQYAHMWDQGNAIFSHHLLIDSKIVGSWQRTLKKDVVIVEIKPFVPLSEAQSQAVAAAAQRYGAFLGLPVVLA